MTTQLLTPSLVREFLSYNPNTGEFTWLPRDRIHFAGERHWRMWNSRFAGKPIGSMGTRYYRIVLFYRLYPAHRLAWAWMTGEWPEEDIDHIDHDGSNNRWSNLRAVSHKDNARNLSLKTNNTSGINGVSFDVRRNKWTAYIQVDGKSKYLGAYVDLQEAAKARESANVQYGFHENHGAVAA